MTYSAIKYELAGRVALITLNRPDTGNRIDPQLAAELADACRRVSQEDATVAVVTGAGDSFCLGSELDEAIKNNLAPPAGLSAASALAGIDRPVIAAINGDALGAGLELALACDIRLASSRARFGLPQVTKGFIPGDGGTQRLPRIVGRGKAFELIVTGEIIDAAAALEIGLVTRVIAPDKLAEASRTLAADIAAKAPIALRYAKEAINQGMDLTMEQGLRLEADLYFLIHTTRDRTEGIKSFLEKRPPHFEGK